MLDYMDIINLPYEGKLLLQLYYQIISDNGFFPHWERLFIVIKSMYLSARELFVGSYGG
jgi:hypothetical protein